jgi:DNA-binding MarR family transcriptional regulator
MTQQNIRELFIREEKARKQMISPLLSSIGLTPGQGQARILYHLLEEDHITQKEIADKCHFDAPTMSRNLDKLGGMGLLTRENNPDCRRSFLICLTPKGRSEAEQIRKVFDQFDTLLCQDIAEEELDVFCKVLMKICDNLEGNKTIFQS